MGKFVIRFTTTSEGTGKVRRQRTQPMELEEAIARFNREYREDKAEHPQRGRVTVDQMTVTVKVPGKGIKEYSVLPYTDWNPAAPEN